MIFSLLLFKVPCWFFSNNLLYQKVYESVKSCTDCCYVRSVALIVGGIPWLETGATQYHAPLGLPNKDCAIKGLVVCNNWDLQPLDLLNGLPLGCYQPSPEVLYYIQLIFYLICRSCYMAAVIDKRPIVDIWLISYISLGPSFCV